MKIKSLYKEMKAIRILTVLLGIAAILIISLSIEGARSLEAQAYQESSGLKVFVNLYHNKRDSAELCVYSYEQDLGCDRINLSGYASPVQWGPWKFNSEAVKVGSKFTACVTNLRTHERECTTGTNGLAKKPEYVYLTMSGQRYSSSNDEGVLLTDPYSSSSLSSPRQQQHSTNWEAVCKTFDVFIAEPCNTLAYGTKLTPLGEHVIRCFAAGGLLLLYDPSGNTLAAAKALGPIVGCGGGLVTVG